MSPIEVGGDPTISLKHKLRHDQLPLREPPIATYCKNETSKLPPGSIQATRTARASFTRTEKTFRQDERPHDRPIDTYPVDGLRLKSGETLIGREKTT